VVASGGAKAIATSSWSVANANGFTDGEHIPLALSIDNLHRIVGATQQPVTIDIESGYGDARQRWSVRPSLWRSTRGRRLQPGG
jgi:2-methylisocitrate lyase-like PEP mutase family enzyme